MSPVSRSSSGADRGATSAQAAENATGQQGHTAQEALIGTDRPARPTNVSWGAIFAGTVTFLALTVVLAMASLGMGLDDRSATATGIWTIIALAVALAIAGYVAGALAVRSGLLHGFVTWAASLLAIVILAGWLSTNLLGAVGNLAGVAAQQVNISASQARDAAQQAQGQISQQDIDAAKQRAREAADTASTGVWWTFAGALIGAVIAAAAGVGGARSVINKDTAAVPGRTPRV